MAERCDNDTPRRPARVVDWFALLAGVATLLVSVYVLSDGSTWLPNMDFRWVLAGAAVLVGMLMLGSSVRCGGRKG